MRGSYTKPFRFHIIPTYLTQFPQNPTISSVSILQTNAVLTEYRGIYSYIFLYILYIPPHSSLFLYIPIHSTIFLYIPQYSYIFLYIPLYYLYSSIFFSIPIYFSIFLYIPIHIYIYIYILCMSVCLFGCLFICLCHKNVKISVRPRMTSGIVYGWSNFQKCASNKIRF